MTRKPAIVAVETNLIGRQATPKEHSQWPFDGAKGFTDDQAEVVACFVSDLNEQGAIKFLLRGVTTGALRECYPHQFSVLRFLGELGAQPA